jgi:Domain of unknown function (DUF4340)
MRSFGTTLILALLATLFGGLALWRWEVGNFNSLLGAPPTPLGQRLYRDFKPADVIRIQVSQNTLKANFELTENGWRATVPWQDRMDPSAALGIIQFTLGMRVEDLARRDEIDSKQSGLGEDSINIRLEGKDGQSLAKYKIGSLSSWLANVQDIEKPVPTLFIAPLDRKRKSHTYICTGDITPIFKDGLKYLRDHRPFFFNPITLQSVRIRAEQGELTLQRENPDSPWRITKPLNLSTDPVAIKSLLEGLYDLRAARISSPSSTSVPVPTKDNLGKSSQISIRAFGSEMETTLDISPPSAPDSRDVMATVSDRPGTLFEIPLKPEPNLVSLASLPLAINDLRDCTLTHLNVQSLRQIRIQPSTGQEILISRKPPQPWMCTIAQETQQANEELLFNLLKAATQTRVSGFVSDAATDFTPWGLDHPFLKISFISQDLQSLELAFGLDAKGGIFVNRSGTPTVMRVPPSLITAIPIQPYQWQLARLWAIDRNNLMAIERSTPASPSLTLSYDANLADSWSATSDGKNITASLDQARANFTLGVLEGLKVSRWLAPSEGDAALATPSLTLKIIEKSTDDLGDLSGFIIREASFAPVTTGPDLGSYYGRLRSSMKPFLIDRETYRLLTLDLIEKD